MKPNTSPEGWYFSQQKLLQMKNNQSVLSADRMVGEISIPKGTPFTFDTERLMGGWGSGGSRVTTIWYQNTEKTSELYFHRGRFPLEEFDISFIPASQ